MGAGDESSSVDEDHKRGLGREIRQHKVVTEELKESK